MSPKVAKVDQSTALDLADLSQLVAIRWDLVPWGLVLDLNCSELPDGDGGSRRGWLVFEGVSEFTWSLKNSRLPTGLMLINSVEIAGTEANMTRYNIWHLAPTINNLEEVVGNPTNVLTISAQSMSGFVSGSIAKTQESWLNFEERNSLATDADFRFAIKSGAD